VAGLRGFNTTGLGNAQVSTAGYTTAGDGGGNRFYWSSTSTAADNNGTIIKPDLIPTGSPGRWLALDARTVNVRAFGARGDGVNDDTAAIQKTVDFAKLSGAEILFDRGTFILANLVTIDPANQLSLRGAGKGLTVLKGSISTGGAATIFLFSNGSNFSIRGITFDNNNNTVGSSPVQTYVCNDFTFADCAFINTKRFGLAIQSCQRFWLRDNYFNCTELNQTIHTASIKLLDDVLGPPTGPAWITGNEINGAQAGGRGIDIFWAYNRITNFGYGSGIISGHDGAGNGTHRWTIVGKRITGGRCGTDGTQNWPKGMEIYAKNSTIIGNTCYGNSGGGIWFGGKSSVVANNLCYDNGCNLHSAAGITASYVSPNVDPSNSIITGNTCRQIAGINQNYGFLDTGALSAATALHFSNNDFSGNQVSDFFKDFGSASTYTWVTDTLQGSTQWTPGSIAPGTSVSKSITINGATIGNSATAGFDQMTNNGLIITAKVYATNSALATIYNPTGGSLSLPLGNLYIIVQKRAPWL
jgi:parallel beta-helix repeat protein